MIPLSVPNLKGNELKYVTEAILSEWVSTVGPYVTEFEQELANYVHAEGAVACQNGTAGIHIALLICGVKSEDEVIVPALTFIAAVNPVRYIHAEPIFMDCDDSLCIDPQKLEEFCEQECLFQDQKLINKQTKKQISAIVVVHVFGNMANMERLLEIAAHYNLKVIEDATEALGTYYTEGQYAGKYAGTLGDIGVYSFNGNKIITTGSGGILVSNHKELLVKAKHLTTQAKKDELYYEHDEVGFNYRMTNIQAALGKAQLEQLEEFIDRKNANYYSYVEQLKDISGLHLLHIRKGIRSNRWFYSLFCGEKFGLNRDQFIQYLKSKGIQSRPVWGLICDQIPYKHSQSYKIQKAIYFQKHIVNIPCSTNLTKEDICYIAEVIKMAGGKKDEF